MQWQHRKMDGQAENVEEIMRDSLDRAIDGGKLVRGAAWAADRHS